MVMGRDDRPGEVAGWGPVLADVARNLVARQHAAEWRFAITDDEGHLVLAGSTRRRPRRSPPDARECHAGIVELQVPARSLAEVAGDLSGCGEWAGVVADIAERYERRETITRRLDSRPLDRYSRAALRRHVQIRDRTCSAPGCRRPAARSDQDHTVDHARGGATVAANVGPLCEYHHAMKAEAGWSLEQPHPGRFRWTSPLGEIYHTRGEVIWPPLPRARPRRSDQDPDEPLPESLVDGPGQRHRRRRRKRRVRRRHPPPDPPASRGR
jgi:hypothetical protein